MVRVFNMGVLNVSFIANEDLSAYQYHFVESAGSANEGYVVLADSGSATYSPIGVLQNAPESGEEATVCMFGPTKIHADYAAGTIDIGEWLTCNGSGEAEYTAVASLAVGFSLSPGDSSASNVMHMFFDPMASWLTRRTVN